MCSATTPPGAITQKLIFVSLCIFRKEKFLADTGHQSQQGAISKPVEVGVPLILGKSEE